MRHMSNLKSLKAMFVICVGLLFALAFAPAWTQARVDRTIAGPVGGDEGDPLDSNDYSSGGSGNTGDDIYEQTIAPDRDLGSRLVSIVVFKDGKVLVPFFSGAILTVRIIELPVLKSAAVEYAD